MKLLIPIFFLLISSLSFAQNDSLELLCQKWYFSKDSSMLLDEIEEVLFQHSAPIIDGFVADGSYVEFEVTDKLKINVSVSIETSSDGINGNPGIIDGVLHQYQDPYCLSTNFLKNKHYKFEILRLDEDYLILKRI